MLLGDAVLPSRKLASCGGLRKMCGALGVSHLLEEISLGVQSCKCAGKAFSMSQILMRHRVYCLATWRSTSTQIAWHD